MVRQRHTKSPRETASVPSRQPTTSKDDATMAASGLRSQWIFFAVASGACAAFNGVFAKLTTTELTTIISQSIASFLGLSDIEKFVEIAVRAAFFALNLTFNGVMWTLFTTALARGTSTTQVSIMNTSTNFMLTALLGLFIFSESLPPMWWAGATLLIIGNVIVGRKDESKDAAAAEAGYVPVVDRERTSGDGDANKDDEDEDVIDLGNAADDRTR
ncbi:hypothetical protein B0I35DRAFT_416191 [Stachybotrys elegans]|uniref:EamA domain-containing protein n=1 Tax=Stachybotrys elegans TaxID=80388 RepID=A0A8K0SZX3_9HYPO|nr:hypothetical protein B0I35DRAFT_416191 [Stachybotrys elegans]